MYICVSFLSHFSAASLRKVNLTNLHASSAEMHTRTRRRRWRWQMKMYDYHYLVHNARSPARVANAVPSVAQLHMRTLTQLSGGRECVVDVRPPKARVRRTQERRIYTQSAFWFMACSIYIVLERIRDVNALCTRTQRKLRRKGWGRGDSDALSGTRNLGGFRDGGKLKLVSWMCRQCTRKTCVSSRRQAMCSTLLSVEMAARRLHAAPGWLYTCIFFW